MKIHQLYTHSFLRNFTYLIEMNNKTAIVIDPWEEGLVNTVLSKRNLNLTAIINTHEHWDHTQGNQALVDGHGCEVWAHENGQGKIPGLTRVLSTGEIIEFVDEEIEKLQKKVAEKYGYNLVDHKLELYGIKKSKS